MRTLETELCVRSMQRPGGRALHDVGPPDRPLRLYDERGEVAQAFPSTGRTFAITQTHWFRLRDGQVAEHWANRDDLGMATQLGWIPPTPAFLWRMVRSKRHARRDQAASGAG